MQTQLKKLTDSTPFQHFITLSILAAGFLVGMETYPGLRAEFGGTLGLLNKAVLGIFIVEVILKLIANGKDYFKDGWNLFDFSIVIAGLLPIGGPAITVVRLLRLLRTLKLLHAFPKLQILVGALLKSVPSMGYVTLLLFLFFYVYAVAAVFIFGGNDPLHFADLPHAMLNLFRVATLEDWTDVMYINMFGCDQYGYEGARLECTAPQARPVFASLFFVSFVLIGTMIIMNLFVGVILNGMEEAHTEALRKRDEAMKKAGTLPTMDDELEGIEKQLADLQKSLQHVHMRISEHRKSTPGSNDGTKLGGTNLNG